MRPDPPGTTMPEIERRAAFSDVYESCYRDVVAFAFRRCYDRTIATEIATDTFAVVWRRLDEMPDGQQARLWIFGVARLVLSNESRSQRRRTRLASHVAAVVASQPAMSDVDDDGRVEEALQRMAPGDAELLRLSYWEGLSPAEIAVVVDVLAPTVRSQLTRARQRFAVEYDTVSGRSRSDRFDAGHVSTDEHLPAPDCEERNR